MRRALVLTMLACLTACSAGGAAPPGRDTAGATAGLPMTSPTSPAASAPASPAPLDRIQVAYAVASAGFAVPLMAKEAGLFERYGLDAEVSYIASGPTMIQSLLAGEVQFGEIAAPASMNAYVEGGHVVWITSARNRPLFYLVARPEVQTVEDLRGKPLGVTRIGTTTHTFMRLVVQRAGMDPERDVQMLQTGGIPETVGAMVTGRISAALVTPPSHVIPVREGMHVILDLSKMDFIWAFAGSVTTRRHIASHPDRVRRYLMAYAEALHLLRTDRERAIDVIGKITVASDRASAEQAWEIFGPEFQYPPFPERAAMEAVVREELAHVNPRARDVPPEDFYDDRILRDLESEGFFTQVTIR
jgi:NitT/TauT family transport system substrate-binding protein